MRIFELIENNENFANATKQDFLAFKKFVKGTTHLFKNYNNMSEEEQDELLADLVKLQFDSNLMNSFPKWKEYAIKTMKNLDDERIQKVFKQAGLVENFADGKKKETIEETIRKQGDKYVIYSKDGKKKLGTYDSRKAAEKRLGQIEYFKHAGK